MSLNNTTSIADVSNVGPLDSLKAQIDVLYIPLGLALSVCSTLLFGTIVCHEALRDMKEYLVIAGLALADGLSGLATAFAGGYRTYLRLFGLTYQAVSRRHCMLMPHNLIWNISDVLQCFMLLAVSLDRFFIVLVPLHYLGWGLSYAYTLIGSIYLGTILQALFFMAMSYPHTELDQIAECRTKHAFFRDHHAIRKSARVAAALSSIAIYGGVILAYRRRIAATAKNGNVDQAELSFQRKLTKTTGKSCLCTLIFNGIPQILSIGGLYYAPIKSFYGLFNAWAWAIGNLNPMANLFIYSRNQKEVRVGLKALLTCKELAPNVNMWQTEKPKKSLAQTQRGKKSKVHPEGSQLDCQVHSQINQNNGSVIAVMPAVVDGS